jgi:hypothetical protein
MVFLRGKTYKSADKLGYEPAESRDGTYNQMSAQALIAVLIMSFTFNSNGLPNELNDIAACDFDADSGACQVCSNICGSCGASTSLLGIYRLIAYLCVLAAGLSVVLAVGVVITLHEVHLDKVEVFLQRTVPVRKAGHGFLVVSALTFFGAMACQAGIALPDIHFKVFITIAVLSLVLYAWLRRFLSVCVHAVMTERMTTETALEPGARDV